jgi:SAM-dependent methyltransferase
VAQTGDAGLSGTGVEIGFGSGLNLPADPPAWCTRSPPRAALTARRRAEERIAASHVHVEHIALYGESIHLNDDSCDGAPSTFTLCTIPRVQAALAEVHRVLRPGGWFHFLDSGSSVARSAIVLDGNPRGRLAA